MKQKLTLEELRSEIDEIDEKILGLLKAREDKVITISELKRAAGIAAHQPARFEELLNKLKSEADVQGLDKEYIEKLWNTIHEHSLKIQK